MGTLKHLEREPLVAITIKLTPVEKEQFKKRAQEFCKGNMSEWVRYATLNCKPPKSARTE